MDGEALFPKHTRCILDSLGSDILINWNIQDSKKMIMRGYIGIWWLDN